MLLFWKLEKGELVTILVAHFTAIIIKETSPIIYSVMPIFSKNCTLNYSPNFEQTCCLVVSYLFLHAAHDGEHGRPDS